MIGADPQHVTGTSRAREIERTLLSKSPHAVLLVRPDWSIAYANGQAIELAKNPDLLEATLWSAVPGFASPEARAEVVRPMEDRGDVEFEPQIPANQGLPSCPRPPRGGTPPPSAGRRTPAAPRPGWTAGDAGPAVPVAMPPEPGGESG